MRMWDEGRMADLVAEQSRLRGELAQVSTRLNDMKNSDTAWDESRHQSYQTDQLYHAQITRELGVVSSDITALDRFRPERVRQSAETPLTRFLRRGQDGLEASERDAFLGESEHMGGMAFIVRPEAATRSDNNSGEELVPETVIPNVVDRLAYFGGVSRMSQRFMTATGNEHRVPQHDEASQKGEILGNQNTTVADQDLANFGVITFGAKTCSSRQIFITREMLQDSIVDVAAFASARAVRRMGRTWDDEFTTGSTAGQTKGVVTEAKAGVTAASATAVTYDELVNLEYSINRAYRMGQEMGEGGLSAETGGRIGYLMSDDMEKTIRKLKDSDGRPLWWPSTGTPLAGAGVPNSFMGRPYEVSGPMDSVATGKVPLLFGNFSYFGIRTVAAVEIFRFQDSNTMSKNAIAILGFSRRDARAMGAINANKCEAIAKLTMA